MFKVLILHDDPGLNSLEYKSTYYDLSGLYTPPPPPKKKKTYMKFRNICVNCKLVVQSNKGGVALFSDWIN